MFSPVLAFDVDARGQPALRLHAFFSSKPAYDNYTTLALVLGAWYPESVHPLAIPSVLIHS